MYVAGSAGPRSVGARRASVKCIMSACWVRLYDCCVKYTSVYRVPANGIVPCGTFPALKTNAERKNGAPLARAASMNHPLHREVRPA